ncbi:hypothetical protein OUZ56_032763 [Daphnia magna]|uniref:guanylate cyclase n=1 Tax=Daphnia magna TaxID=35525 RepID=A0ABQ9ZX32_9CRUS|nr:hypothetical protein OUZ56_032763 [Daphnia magna]
MIRENMMRVMNYPVHPNKLVDDWRMKVWNKSIKWTSSWPALDCETIGEIRQMRRHDNINPIICAIIEPVRICIITEFQTRKSLMLRNAVKDSSKKERDHYFAPEILRNPSLTGTAEGDVYSFAIILHEMVCQEDPFAICYDLGDPARIINQIKHTVRGCQIPARLPIESLDFRLAYMFLCMVNCWIDDPNERRYFSSVLNYLTKQGGTRSVANCLANGLPVEAELWENVTVFEADLEGFTEIASETTPLGILILLDDVYTSSDSIARGYDVCKLGTISDAYIVPTRGKNSAGEIASMALEVVEKMKGSGIGHSSKPLVVRIGVHTGSCFKYYGTWLTLLNQKVDGNDILIA